MEKLVRLSDTEVRTLGIPADEVWRNELYRVSVFKKAGKFDGRNVVHLCIRRHDNTPIHSWGDFQAIKNQVLGPEGPECVGVEFYPAESDLNDQRNIYHLWVIADPKYRFPFGFKGRVTSYDEGERELEE